MPGEPIVIYEVSVVAPTGRKGNKLRNLKVIRNTLQRLFPNREVIIVMVWDKPAEFDKTCKRGDDWHHFYILDRDCLVEMGVQFK